MFSRLKALAEKLAEPVSVVLLYTLAALIFTYPLVLNFGTYVIGDMESDVWKHVWGMWWVRLKLLEECVLPMHTYLLNSPYGGALWFIDTLNGLISVPIQSFFSITESFNLVVLFNLVLAACGAYTLTKGLCRNKYAAFFAGIVYSFSAYMGASIASGITESINIGWLPFFCHYFIRIFKYRRTSDAVKAGIFFSINTVGCWYFGCFAVVFAVYYYIYTVYMRIGAKGRQAVSDLILTFLPKWSGNVCAGILAAAPLYVLGSRSFVTARNLTYDFAVFADLAIYTVCPILSLAGCLAWHQKNPFRGTRFTIIKQTLISLTAVLLLEYAVWTFFDLAWPCSGVKFLGFLAAGLAASVLLTALQIVKTPLNEGAEAESSVPFKIKLKKQIYPSAYTAWLLIGAFYGCQGSLLLASDAFQNASDSGYFHLLKFFILHALALIYLRFFVLKSDRSVKNSTYAYICSLFYKRIFSLYGLCAVLNAVFAFYGYSEDADFTLCMTWCFILACAFYICEKVLESLDIYFKNRFGWSFEKAAAEFYKHLAAKPLIMAAVCFAGIVGPTIAFQSTLNSDSSIVFRGRGKAMVDIHLSREFCNVVNFVDFFIPGKERSIRSFTVDKLIRACYIGWVPLAAALFGCIWGRKRLDRKFWLFAFFIFITFAMGPFMYISENIYSTIKSPIYMFMFNYFPTFSSVSIPFRFSILVMMSTGVLSSYALADVFKRLDKNESIAACAALSMAVMFEVMSFSSSPFPLPLSEARMPEYAEKIAEEKGSMGIIDFPIQRFKGELLPGEYFFYQMGHKKPIPNRVEGTIPLYVYQNKFTSYLFILEHSQGDIPYRSKEDLQSGLDELSRFRFKYLVIHEAYLRTRSRDKINSMLNYYCGRPVYKKDKISIYQVPDFRSRKKDK